MNCPPLQLSVAGGRCFYLSIRHTLLLFRNLKNREIHRSVSPVVGKMWQCGKIVFFRVFDDEYASRF